MDNEKTCDIKIEDIKCSEVCKWEKMFKRAQQIHLQRTKYHHFFRDVAHMTNLYDKEEVVFSEGSTQAIERKVRAQVLQRVPDGEILTQYNKNSIEQAEIDFIFKNKILTSEFSGKDMFKNLWKTFDNAYVYGFGCVRTGFEKDRSGGIRISYKQIPYNMIFPSPDCDSIEEADWYIHEEMISRSELRNLFDENDNLLDKTYDEKTVRYILENKHNDGQEMGVHYNLQDESKGIGKIESVRCRTLYKRGAKEFITYCPTLNAKLRTVKNYDPRKEIPLHFLLLEPDPEFPLGKSSILPTLSQQQFADMFQSNAYNTLLLALHPPLQAWGDLTETDVFLEPGAWWSLGNNPNAKIEKFPVETTTTNQYGAIMEQIAGSMARNMNIQDGTIASDAHVPGWSKTAQGVEQQQNDQTITVNQYRKRMETFFSEWCNHALRSYLSAMGGKQMITVDEDTRNKIKAIEDSVNEEQSRSEFGIDTNIKSIIDGNQVEFDFDLLSADRLEFKVRTGSLIQSRQDVQRQNIQELLVPVSQTIGALSDANRPVVEQSMLQMIQRLFELSDVDFSHTAGQRINDQLIVDALKGAYIQIVEQNKAIEQLQQLMLNGGQPPQQQQQGQPMQEQSGQPVPAQVPEQPIPGGQQMSPEQA